MIQYAIEWIADISPHCASIAKLDNHKVLLVNMSRVSRKTGLSFSMRQDTTTMN